MTIDFDKMMDSIPSLSTKSHAQIIYGLIRWLRPNKVVEIGAYCGYTTCHIAKAMKDAGINPSSMLYVIDNFSLHNITPAQIANALTHAGVNEVPHYIVVQDSQTMTDWPAMDMAIIDGDHSYEGAKNDWNNCVEAGAEVIVLHDTVEWWGPRQLVEEIRTHWPDWSVIESNHDNGLAICILNKPKAPPVHTQGKDVNERTR